MKAMKLSDHAFVASHRDWQGLRAEPAGRLHRDILGGEAREAPMAWTDARRRLRALATRAAQLDGGRVANRLSAYAMILKERADRGDEMCADVEQLARATSSKALAELLDEACRVMRAAFER